LWWLKDAYFGTKTKKIQKRRMHPRDQNEQQSEQAAIRTGSNQNRQQPEQAAIRMRNEIEPMSLKRP
jgi:hypothetical protein